jgi:hypothetical protein
VTGPEHYRQAEQLLAAVNRRIAGDDRSEYVQTASRRAELRAEAQVHATLALAAATATGTSDHPAADWDEWRPVVSNWRKPD